MKRQITILRENNKCWNFFKVQKDHVLNSTKKVRKIIKDINKKGYSDLSDLIWISESLDIIENQMPNNSKEE